jgi:hypothetical protein
MNRSDLREKYKIVFLGTCIGIGLAERGPNDPHVIVQILVEDDDNWFTSEYAWSSFWLPDLQIQLDECKSWIERHCNRKVGGWEFKKDEPNDQQAVIS